MTPKEVDGRVNRLLDSVRKPFRALIKRVNASTPTAKIQVDGLSGETGQDFELMQSFGFTSNPPVDTQAVVLALGGKTSHSVIIATENGAYRVKSLQSGEVAIYNQDGAQITLKKGKIIDVECTEYNVKCEKYNVNASSGAKFDTPMLETSQKLTSQGQISGNNGMTIQGGDGGETVRLTGNMTHTSGHITSNGVVLDTHTHTDSMGGTTGNPI